MLPVHNGETVMDKRAIAAGALAAGLMSASGAAAASNELVLMTEDEFLNKAEITVEGNDNRLLISQEHTGAGGLNTITATIKGDLNGGPLGAAFTGAARLTGLQPGTLTQRGFSNTMTVEVDGTANLFAFAQIGSGNMLRASITGHANQSAVLQTGMNNLASFSQNGIGNIVSITQHSW